jgi:hypothetical protein
VRQSEPTAVEQQFFGGVSRRVADLQDWYHADDDGTPWMVVSYDVVRDSGIVATLRCDYDGARLLGGWSPGLLNWDDGVRAGVAGVVTSPPDGLDLTAPDPEAAASLAATWFERVIGLGPRA